jgi:tyrosine-protein kinase Etk/Wzc
MSDSPLLVSKSFDLIRVLNVLRKGLWIILLTGMVGYLLSVLFLRYAPAKYEAISIIRVKSDNLSRVFTTNDFEGKLEPQNDKGGYDFEIIKSRALIKMVAKKLKLQVAYQGIGRLTNSSLYNGNVPFVVEFDSLHFNLYDQPLTVRPLKENPSRFTIVQMGLPEAPEIEAAFNDSFQISGNVLRLVRIPDRPMDVDNSVRFTVRSERKLIAEIYAKTTILPHIEGRNLYQILYQDDVPRRASDIVNGLVDEFLLQDLQKRRQTYDQVISFLDSVSLTVAKEVSEKRLDLSQVEQRQDVPVYLAQRETKLGRVGEIETAQLAIQSQRDRLLKLSEDLKTMFTDFGTKVSFGTLVYVPALLNTSVTQLETTLTEQITLLNDQLGQREQLLRRQKTSSPVAQENLAVLYRQLTQLQLTISEQMRTLNTEETTLKAEYRKLRGSLSNYPIVERSLEAAGRSYEIAVNYFYLLKERQTETQISRAGVVSEHVVIASSDPPSKPISPNKSLIQFIGPFAGLLFGFFLVIARELLRTRIKDRLDVERISQLPIVGEIVEYTDRSKGVGIQLFHETNSPFTESMRSLRTNLLFLTAKDVTKVIAVTSTISGEGKSITSLNLAASFAIMGKRVLLVDADLRKPSLHQALKIEPGQGLSDFLVGYAEWGTIIRSTSYQNLDFMPAGTLAPNPTELFASARFTEFIEQAKQEYDYVVIDTSPVGLVVDALHVLKLVHIGLYMVRVNYSQLHFVERINDLAAEQGFKNLVIALNCVDFNYQGYGHGYGYGYYTGAPKVAWYSQLRKRFFG